MNIDFEALRNRILSILYESGRPRAVNFAQELGISEKELVEQLVHRGLNRTSNVIGSGILKGDAWYARSETHSHRVDGG